MAEAKSSHWEEYYARASLALEPSSFARHITSNGYVKLGDTLLDIGCGNGRDSLHFASCGVGVTGIDGSHAAIDILNQEPRNNATFITVDINDEAFQDMSNFDHFYMRFFLHAVTPIEEAKIWDVLKAAPPGARVLAEFRTVNDPLMDKGEVLSSNERMFGHYRRFLEVEGVIGRLRDIGFTRTLLRSEEGNLSIASAVDGTDDNPVLGRVIVDKPKPPS